MAQLVSTGPILTRPFAPFTPPAAALVRPRLLALLDGALARRLTLIMADSGYGKTTLLGQWGAALGDIPQAWFALRSGDAQPRVFERHLVALLAHLGPLRRVVATVDQGLDALERDSLLVLDDVHLPSEKGQALLRKLLEIPLLHLVLACRVPLALPLARLRLQGEVAELGAGDLAFTPEEIAALRLDGDPQEVWSRTQGWPVAVGLVRSGGSVRVADNPAELFHLLAEEVWSHVAPAERQVLEAAAVAGTLDAVLARQLTGHPRPSEVLDGYAARGWLTPGPPGRYHCHLLFREYVLQHVAPAALADLAGQVLRHRIEQQDWLEAAAVSASCDRATRWEFVAHHGSAVANAGGVTAIRQALEDLPYDPAEPPRLTVHRGRQENQEGKYAAALRWLELAEEAAQAREEWRTLAHAAASRADALAHRGEYAEAAAVLRRALQRIGDRDPAANAELEGILPWSLFHLGDVVEAFQTLDRAQRWYEERGDFHPEALCLRRRGAFHSMRGELAEALKFETKALARFQQLRIALGEANTRGNLAATLGRAGRFSEAVAQAQSALTVAERHGLAGVAQDIRLALSALHAEMGGALDASLPRGESEREALLWHLFFARASRRRGQLHQAWQSLGAARALLAGQRPIFARRVEAEEGALLLQQSDVERAVALLDSAVQGLWDGPLRVESYLPRLHRAYGRLRLGDASEARDDVEILLAWRTQADLGALWSQEAWAAVPVLTFARQKRVEPGFAASVIAGLTTELGVSTEPQVRVEVLGPTRLHRGGQVSTEAFERPQVRALLGYLAIHHPRAVPTSEVVEALWPQAGSIEESSLYTTVSRLRRVLGREAVVKDGMGYRLGPGVEVDVRLFDAALAADPLRIKEALDLYRGDLLADLPLAEWSFLARETYRNRFLEAATRYGESLLAQERFRDAQAAFERALEADPLHEPSVQGLMRAVMLSGSAPAALQTFQRFSARLSSELGLAPSDETLRLAERLGIR